MSEFDHNFKKWLRNKHLKGKNEKQVDAFFYSLPEPCKYALVEQFVDGIPDVNYTSSAQSMVELYYETRKLKK